MQANTTLREIIDAARFAENPHQSVLHSISFLRFLNSNGTRVTDPQLRNLARTICVRLLGLISPFDSHPFSEEMRSLAVGAFVSCIEPVKLM